MKASSLSTMYVARSTRRSSVVIRMCSVKRRRAMRTACLISGTRSSSPSARRLRRMPPHRVRRRGKSLKASLRACQFHFLRSCKHRRSHARQLLLVLSGIRWRTCGKRSTKKHVSCKKPMHARQSRRTARCSRTRLSFMRPNLKWETCSSRS